MDQVKSQFIVAPFGFWGHTRHLLQLSLNLLAVHPKLCITFLTIPPSLPAIRSEIDSTRTSPTVVDRLRVVPVDGLKDEDEKVVDDIHSKAARAMQGFNAGIPGVLSDIIGGSGEGWNAKVKLVIVDMMWGSFGPSLREVEEQLGLSRIPMLIGNPWPGNWFLHWWGPDGRLSNFTSRANKIVSGEGKSFPEACDDITDVFENEIIDVPGMPKVYGYELRPQTAAIVTRDPRRAILFQQATEHIEHSDGILLTMPEHLEPGAKEGVLAMHPEKFVERKDKSWDCIEVGPQFPDWFWRGERADVEDAEVRGWLDGKRKGEVIYISFGSLFWPIYRPDLITDLLTTLLEAKFPFILSTMPQGAEIPDELAIKIKESGLGLIVKKVDQRAVLMHPNVGYALTHCGLSGFFECILTEKPMVAWPITADQPHMAAFASELGVAIELFQVRTGASVNLPTTRGPVPVDKEDVRREEMMDVWARIRGDQGERMQVRVREVKKGLVESWEKGGMERALKGFDRFVDSAA